MLFAEPLSNQKYLNREGALTDKPARQLKDAHFLQDEFESGGSYRFPGLGKIKTKSAPSGHLVFSLESLYAITELNRDQHAILKQTQMTKLSDDDYLLGRISKKEML